MLREVFESKPWRWGARFEREGGKPCWLGGRERVLLVGQMGRRKREKRGEDFCRERALIECLRRSYKPDNSVVVVGADEVLGTTFMRRREPTNSRSTLKRGWGRRSAWIFPFSLPSIAKRGDAQMTSAKIFGNIPLSLSISHNLSALSSASQTTPCPSQCGVADVIYVNVSKGTILTRHPHWEGEGRG